MAVTKKVVMVLERETKGALRYRGIEDDDPDLDGYLIGTLYLRKAALERPFPTKISVTVEG
jgi:hypothetical protein